MSKRRFQYVIARRQVSHFVFVKTPGFAAICSLMSYTSKLQIASCLAMTNEKMIRLPIHEIASFLAMTDKKGASFFAMTEEENSNSFHLFL